MGSTIRMIGLVAAAGAFGVAACGGEGTGPSEELDGASLAVITALPLDAGAMATPSGGVFPVPTCHWQPESGRYDCQAVSREGVAITRAYAFLDRTDRPQRRYDPVTTASIVTESRLEGAIALPGGAAQLLVDARRRMTVSGLQGEETTQILNGTGTSTNRTSLSGGSFGAPSTSHDTTLNVVVPVAAPPAAGQAPARAIPLSGQRITSSTGTRLLSSGQLVQSVSRQVLTYNGTRMASLDIWLDGERRTCQLDLLNPASACTWTLPG